MVNWGYGATSRITKVLCCLISAKSGILQYRKPINEFSSLLRRVILRCITTGSDGRRIVSAPASTVTNSGIVFLSSWHVARTGRCGGGRPRQYVCECTGGWHARHRRCMYTRVWKDELALARSLRWMAQLINRVPFAVDTPGFPRGRVAAFWPSRRRRRRFVTFFSATL